MADATKIIEAKVLINGKKLTPGQSMALRVALTMWLQHTSQPNALGDDERGQLLQAAYLARGREVFALMMPFKVDPHDIN